MAPRTATPCKTWRSERRQAHRPGVNRRPTSVNEGKIAGTTSPPASHAQQRRPAMLTNLMEMGKQSSIRHERRVFLSATRQQTTSTGARRTPSLRDKDLSMGIALRGFGITAITCGHQSLQQQVRARVIISSSDTRRPVRKSSFGGYDRRLSGKPSPVLDIGANPNRGLPRRSPPRRAGIAELGLSLEHVQRWNPLIAGSSCRNFWIHVGMT